MKGLPSHQGRVVRGFGYIGMLFFVAITAAALGALGRSWSVAAQRERERELEFRGQEIARAIASYAAATPVGKLSQYPRTFDDLLEDRRQLIVLHHLRRHYREPFASNGEWELVAVPSGQMGFWGVRSAAQIPLLRKTQLHGSLVERTDQWIFSAVDAAGPHLHK